MKFKVYFNKCNIVISFKLKNIKAGRQYHYLWTGQYDKKNGMSRDVSSTNRKTSVMYFM